MLWIVFTLEVKRLEERSIYSKDALKMYAYITFSALLCLDNILATFTLSSS